MNWTLNDKVEFIMIDVISSNLSANVSLSWEKKKNFTVHYEKTEDQIRARSSVICRPVTAEGVEVALQNAGEPNARIFVFFYKACFTLPMLRSF